MKEIKQNMASIASALNPKTLASLDATNVKMVSPRTVQFDCTPKEDGTNRIKVTLTENGEFMVRGYKVEETDMFYNVPASGINAVIEKIGNDTLPPIPTMY